MRRILVLLLLAVPIAALANVFGQKPETTAASAPAARLELLAPPALRGGLLYESRFRVYARRDLKNAILVLSPG